MGSNVFTNALTRINYQQKTASIQWNVTHGIGTNAPIVDVYVLNGGSYEKFIPQSIHVVDSNRITITFSQPYIGYATVM
jgi:hypothetical protein